MNQFRNLFNNVVTGFKKQADCYDYQVEYNYKQAGTCRWGLLQWRILPVLYYAKQSACSARKLYRLYISWCSDQSLASRCQPINLKLSGQVFFHPQIHQQYFLQDRGFANVPGQKFLPYSFLPT